MRVNINEKDLRTGDLLICSANRLVSKLIKKISGSPYSHTAHVIRAYGEVLIVEAQQRGVHVMDFNAWKAKYKYNYLTVRPITPVIESSSNFAKKVLSKTAQRNYDMRALFIEFPIYYLTGTWRGPETEADALIEGKWNCSTLSGWLYDLPEWWKMSPGDIFEICKKDLRFTFM